MPLSANPVLADVFRGDVVESRHRGAYAIVQGGRVRRSKGDVAGPVFLRSAGKPFQAIAALALGVAERFGLDSEEIAILAGSHSGEPRHVRVVRSLLKKGGLREGALRCGIHEPFGARAAEALTRAGKKPSLLQNNCSGKHAGMLLAARVLGAPLESYVDPAHPVQLAIRRVLALYSGVREKRIGIAVDGCTAPTFALPLAALALAFERLVAPDRSVPDELARAAATLRSAVAAHPLHLAGTGRVCTDLVAAAPRALFPKSGAEGVYAIGVGDRRRGSAGIAVKVDDGAARGYRALLPVLVESTGLLSRPELARVRGGPVRRKPKEEEGEPIRNHARAVVGRIVPRP